MDSRVCECAYVGQSGQPDHMIGGEWEGSSAGKIFNDVCNCIVFTAFIVREQSKTHYCYAVEGSAFAFLSVCQSLPLLFPNLEFAMFLNFLLLDSDLVPSLFLNHDKM